MRNFKSILVAASAAVVASAASASAQDWNGIYLGVNFGGGLISEDWHDIVVPSDPGAGVPGTANSASDQGFLGGAQLGYNAQMGPWVWGAEVSFDGAAINASTQCRGGFGDVTAVCGVRNNWAGDVTGRVGAVVGPALLYAKAGGAFGDVVVSAKNLNDFGTFEGNFKSDTDTRFGWTIGFGAELAVTDDTSIALEYDYRDYGSSKANMVASEAVPSFAEEPFSVKVSERLSVITARVNFKID